MIIETKNKNIKLVLKTRKIIDVANILKNKNFEEAFTKAYASCDYEALTKIIYILAENEEGKHAFNSSDAVCDFIDEYKEDGKATISDLYKKIAEALNEEGFFKKKYNKKELEEMTSNPLSTMNMNEIVQKSTEKAMEAIAVEQFQGYKV